MPKCRIVEEEQREPWIIEMREMKPLQIGRTVEKGYLVWRTAAQNVFEVINLSNYRPGGCWSSGSEVEVRLLAPGEKVTLELSND